ncbi:Gx transporter family protein [candidate division WOR-3 bacterium]|nr:Gx transporter family protein [candidate division WOR-3 bacterium]
MQSLNRIAYISIFTAGAISLFVVESLIPQPIPGMRLGLANIFILLVLLTFGFREALLVGILKSVVGSLIIARLLTPSFLFSISGTIMSIIVMALAVKYLKTVSLVGISILGAETHTFTQILIAAFLFFGKASFVYLLVPFVLLSLITGSITGMCTYWLYERTEGKIEFAKAP